jgi:hypothetical protein
VTLEEYIFFAKTFFSYFFAVKKTLLLIKGSLVSRRVRFGTATPGTIFHVWPQKRAPFLMLFSSGRQDWLAELRFVPKLRDCDPWNHLSRVATKKEHRF